MTATAGFAVGAALAAAGVAAFEFFEPFAPVVHQWWFALAVSGAGLYLVWTAIANIVAVQGGSRPLALVALGGVLLAACVAFAAFLVGEPQRVPAAPSQAYRPPRSMGVALEFPAVAQPPSGPNAWPDSVVVDDSGGSKAARAGDVIRAGAFVFRVTSGPIAYVDARAASGKPVTVTQPDAAAFLSPFLSFESFDGDQPADFFALPALHRTVQVDYWAGLPARGIDVPFLALRISEENSSTALYEGVAVSGRTLRHAGVALTFVLGTYPVVTASSAPPLIPFGAGLAMIAAGVVGLLVRGRTVNTK